MSRIRKILVITLLVSIISYDPGAIERPRVISEKFVPGNVRLTNSASRGKEFAACERTIGSFMNKWNIAGASIAISRHGRLVYARGFGFADTTSKTEIEPFSKFRIASISKLITAVGIMKLYEEGKLSLSDKVFGDEAILNDPFFSNPKDKRATDITVGQLLSHEAGWTQRWGDQMFMPLVVAKQIGVDPPVDTKSIVRFALNKRLHFTPGTGRSYSNLGYSILGLVIEKVSGMPYDEFCCQKILEPLGIYDMSLARNLESEKAPFEVTYYEPSDVPLKPSLYGTGDMVPPVYGGNDIEALGGAGAWLSTAPDLLRLILSVDGFDTRQDILSQENIRLMTDEKSEMAPVGWKTTLSNGTWWRTGSFPGTAGMMKRQSDGIAWVVLMNSSAWNGPEIHSYINTMMIRVVAQFKKWPDYDLFEYSLPVPLKDNLNTGLL